MAKADKFTPPRPTSGDTAHLVVSSLLSPLFGAPELFRRFVTPPLEKRQIAWMEVVAESLRHLENQTRISVDDFTKNESFVSVVLQATIVAIRNHHEEKRRALANCILNAGIQTNLNDDLKLAFVRFVDELSPTHILLLRAIRDHQIEIVTYKSYEGLYHFLLNEITISPTPDVFKMMCLELQARGLIRISSDMEDFPGIYGTVHLLANAPGNEAEKLPSVVISEVGSLFLNFISSDSWDT